MARVCDPHIQHSGPPSGQHGPGSTTQGEGGKGRITEPACISLYLSRCRRVRRASVGQAACETRTHI
eukprot:scaffold54121_cov21-Tisochrysis_lutea.AAC.1